MKTLVIISSIDQSTPFALSNIIFYRENNHETNFENLSDEEELFL